MINENEISQMVPVSAEGKICTGDIYRFLGIKSQKSKWEMRRFNDLELKKGNDYTEVIFDYGISGVRKDVNYYVSLDTAKEIIMLERRNDKAKQLRRYFIEAEKKLRETRNLIERPSFKSIPSRLDEAVVAARKLKEIAKIIETPADGIGSSIVDFINQQMDLDFSSFVIPALKTVDIKPITIETADKKQDDQWVNPTNLGIYLSVVADTEKVSPQKTNHLLCAAGLQTKGEKGWERTDKGKEYSKMCSVTILSENSSKIKSQTLWNKDKTADVLLEFI